MKKAMSLMVFVICVGWFEFVHAEALSVEYLDPVIIGERVDFRVEIKWNYTANKSFFDVQWKNIRTSSIVDATTATLIFDYAHNEDEIVFVRFNNIQTDQIPESWCDDDVTIMLTHYYDIDNDNSPDWQEVNSTDDNVEVQCSPVCTDQCVYGQTRCMNSSTEQTCDDWNDDGCDEWGNNRSCICEGSSCCKCSSGLCCDGCNYKSSSQTCGTSTETRCEGTACGDDVQRRTKTQACSGNSSSCNGSVSYSSWQDSTSCNSGQMCNSNNFSCYDTVLCCGSECSIVGQTQCLNSSTQQTCVNQNGCLVWGNNRSCACNNGDCCFDECTTSGQTQCLNSTTERTCGDYDSDSCLEWGNNRSCNCQGSSCCQCSSGLCCDGCNYKSSSQTCSTTTEKRCEGTACSDDVQSRTKTQKCSGNSSSCNGSVSYSSWQDSTSCNSGQMCNSNNFACYDTVLCCGSECSIVGQTQCLNSSTQQTCVNQNGCLVWGNNRSCNCQGSSCCECSHGTCCSDNCHYNSGYTRCAQRSERRCSNVSCGGGVQQKTTYTYCSEESDQCDGREENVGWQTITNCSDNQVCDSSTFRCVDSPICCENDCRVGQTRCLGSNTRQTCGDYDSDNCYEWGNNFSCPCSDDYCIGCQPNWICSSWSCENNDRIRNCHDDNDCGVDEGRPVEYQDCPLRCSGNTCVGCLPEQDHKVCLGNSLVWQDACDNNTEVIEVCSDREPICSDTYTAIWSNGYCAETEDGEAACYYRTETACVDGCEDDQCVNCVSDWQCSDWECVDNDLERNCIDRNGCSNQSNKPSEFQECEYDSCEGDMCGCTLDWQCGEWNCEGDNLTRDCDNFGTCSDEMADEYKPEDFQECAEGCYENQCYNSGDFHVSLIVSDDYVMPGEEIQFTVISSDMFGYEIGFGDGYGFTSFGMHDEWEHTYQENGLYIVYLRVFGPMEDYDVQRMVMVLDEENPVKIEYFDSDQYENQQEQNERRIKETIEQLIRGGN